MAQSKLGSFVESCVSIGIGFGISLGVWLVIIRPLYGIEVSMLSNLEITGIFTIFSVTRSYIVRRASIWWRKRR
jgi:hypothetical protein